MEGTPRFVPDSYCGIRCGICPIYEANVAGTVDALAAARGVPPATLACRGCKSEQCTKWCTDCSLKRCARGKGVEHCYSECDEYPCADLRAHTNVPVFVEDSYCGLYCGACEVYHANRHGSVARLAAERGVPERELFCHGCRSPLNSAYCATCELKRCARSRGVEFCHACAEYPCAITRSFTEGPHEHKRAIAANQEQIQRLGLEGWLAAQRAFWTCAGCGGRLRYYDRQCPRCGCTTRD